MQRRHSCNDFSKQSESSIDVNENLGMLRSATMSKIGNIKNETESYKSEQSSQFIDNFITFNLRIEDSGVGISPENVNNLFLNFGKLEEHESMNRVGTGLGLSICKQLIE